MSPFVAPPVFSDAPVQGSDIWHTTIGPDLVERKALCRERFAASRETRYAEWAEKHGTTPEELQTLASQTAQQLTQAPVALQVPSEDLASILTHGFLTQFHTGVSNGVYKPWRRIDVEYLMLGMDPSVPADDRPRYGYLDLPGVDLDAAGYGDTTLVLKEDVKARSTWCAGDSFNETYTVRVSGFDTPDGDALLSQNLEDAPHATAWDGTINAYCEVQVKGAVTCDDIAYVRGPEHIRALVEAAGLRWEPSTTSIAA